jgi:hypothetical protein
MPIARILDIWELWKQREELSSKYVEQKTYMISVYRNLHAGKPK